MYPHPDRTPRNSPTFDIAFQGVEFLVLRRAVHCVIHCLIRGFAIQTNSPVRHRPAPMWMAPRLVPEALRTTACDSPKGMAFSPAVHSFFGHASTRWRLLSSASCVG